MRVGVVVGLVEQLREMETDSMSIVSCMHIHVYVNFFNHALHTLRDKTNYFFLLEHWQLNHVFHLSRLLIPKILNFVTKNNSRIIIRATVNTLKDSKNSVKISRYFGTGGTQRKYLELTIK
jgi:hypothetical protein